MEQILALEYLLSGVRGLLWPHPLVQGTKCHRFLRSLVLVMFIHCRKPLDMLTRCLALASGRGGRQDGQTGGEVLLAHIYYMDYFWV
jgi:hypothetical protein